MIDGVFWQHSIVIGFTTQADETKLTASNYVHGDAE